MDFAFDADIISTFAKIEKLDLLERVFGKSKLLIAPSVSSDLQRSKSSLVKDVAKSKIFQHVNLNKQESELALEIRVQRKLGMGESETISICKMRSAIFVTNDNKAISFAEKLNINVIDLETILYSLKELISKDLLRQIIDDIEGKDKVVVVSKEKIIK